MGARATQLAKCRMLINFEAANPTNNLGKMFKDEKSFQTQTKQIDLFEAYYRITGITKTTYHGYEHKSKSIVEVLGL